ncbi:hypothetical protein [Cohnella luojiensis]|uniref:Secreted protein n=1 Tax=Cohnella luojiensis TaxID=652876 RepID=A0A4Y8LRJ4_9BACL|nr:hypothetical protein [Cohnella luojiensis]TFE23977.1 hypothetical protein E2980_17330 [Cohnella luojiensis]
MKIKWPQMAAFVLIVGAVAIFATGLINSDKSDSGIVGQAEHIISGGMKDMAFMPAVDKDMEDPFLDPMAMSKGHNHASAQTETVAEKGIKVIWSWPEGKPTPGKTRRLALNITDSSGKAVEKFDWNNEKLLHLVVISKDLKQFQHIHPDYKGNGRFEIAVSFTVGGDYEMFADFVPSGLSELTRAESVKVSGAALLNAPLEASDSLTATVSGVQVELRFGHLMAKMQTGMTFAFRDEKTGKPIDDLEYYLGSVGHTIIVDSQLKQYIHVHPFNWASSGPLAVFGVTFPESGIYKVWGQFQRKGKVFVVPFVIHVP